MPSKVVVSLTEESVSECVSVVKCQVSNFAVQ